MGYLGGFLVTLRQHRLFGGKQVTTEYTGGYGGKGHHDEKIAKPERLHGRHVLNRYEDGMEKCIGCELCAGVCPARCIYVRGADNPVDDPVSPGERYGYVYEINYLRCIHCDLCVEACPTEAITESKMFEFSFVNRRDAIYTKAELVVGDDGRPQQLPWEDWREGDDELTSGWMRATAPNGAAEFEGQVGWSGELGYGVRAPEPSQRAEHTTRVVNRGDDHVVGLEHGESSEASAERGHEHSSASDEPEPSPSREAESSEAPAERGHEHGSASDPAESSEAPAEGDDQHSSASDEAEPSGGEAGARP